MFGQKKKMLLVLLIAIGSLASIGTAANQNYRQRYSSWNYQPARTYYYRQYFYKPTPTYTGYDYHYCIYYPSRPTYIYYYNPVRKVYWGRYDLEKQGYSMLEEKDRKEKLDDIPEEAFPKPGEMPAIPGAEDGEKIEKIGKDDLPKDDLPE